MPKQARVLFLVHVEEMFRGYFPDDFYAMRVYKAAIAKQYDRVILLDTKINELGPYGHTGIIHELKSLNLEKRHWSYGYEWGYDYGGGELIRSHGHCCTWVPPFITDELEYFQNAIIHIGGGSDGECLADWESVLRHLGLEYERRKDLIY